MTLDVGNQQLIEGLTVFGDDSARNKFYVMPNEPRFRVDSDTKKPVFSFIKYKLPVDRPDGKKGGGFVVFDAEFVVPDDKMKKIKAALDTKVQNAGFRQGAEIDHISFTDATASIQLLDGSNAAGGLLVSKINSPAKPSLFGSMICPVTVELTPEGATVVEAVMKGSGAVMQITYTLHFAATFPPVTCTVWFNATKFYSFYQTMDKSGGSWDSSDNTETDTQREAFISSSSGNVDFEEGSLGLIQDADLRKKIQDDISNWGFGQIDQAAKALILPDIKPADPSDGKGMEHYKKVQSTYESASFYRHYSQRMGVSYFTSQGGTIPNLTDMGFKWQDFFHEVDANDPFFATIMASFAVNADFDRFGITSVDVHCEYTKTNPATIKDFHFTKPDDIGKFDSDTKDGDMHYAYSFAVNYKDQSQSYQSPLVTTNKGQVTINANDLGILYVGLAIGNVDFTKTPQVQVAITYPETDANKQPISQQFTFDKDKKSDRMLAVLLKPVDKDYKYQITYIMPDGTQMVVDWLPSQSSTLFINSPFTLHTFSFLAEGDFTNSIDNIFLKMRYTDDANKLGQEFDYEFKQGATQKDWTIPIVANSKGQITYSGVISYKNHTTEDIPDTTTSSDLITFGPPNQVIVSVLPDTTLIDFTKVKLVKVDLEYADPAHKIDVKHDFVLKQGATPQPWTFYARDPSLTSYTWSATFYTGANPPPVARGTSSDSDLILMMPD
jgi:hypothetical protein